MGGRLARTDQKAESIYMQSSCREERPGNGTKAKLFLSCIRDMISLKGQQEIKVTKAPVAIQVEFSGIESTMDVTKVLRMLFQDVLFAVCVART